MTAEDFEFVYEELDSGTYPAQCSSLKKNGHVMLKGHPCRIVDMSTSKTGKHGHAKAHIVGLHLFTDSKYEDSFPSSHSVEVPTINKREYQLIYTEDGFLQVMDNTGALKEYKLPEGDLGKEIEEKAASGTDYKIMMITFKDMERVVSITPLTLKK